MPIQGPLGPANQVRYNTPVVIKRGFYEDLTGKIVGKATETTGRETLFHVKPDLFYDTTLLLSIEKRDLDRTDYPDPVWDIPTLTWLDGETGAPLDPQPDPPA